MQPMVTCFPEQTVASKPQYAIIFATERRFASGGCIARTTRGCFASGGCIQNTTEGCIASGGCIQNTTRGCIASGGCNLRTRTIKLITPIFQEQNEVFAPEGFQRASGKPFGGAMGQSPISSNAASIGCIASMGCNVRTTEGCFASGGCIQKTTGGCFASMGCIQRTTEGCFASIGCSSRTTRGCFASIDCSFKQLSRNQERFAP